MLFNSFLFLFFFIAVYFLYRILDHRSQNRMLLVASYLFYGTWDWRFLGLILATTLIDYLCGLQIDRNQEERKRKFFLIVSIVSSLGILGFFKYFNFFAGNFTSLAHFFGWHPDPVTLNIVLPVGISFYTFQSMSYTIDVYRRRLKAESNFFDFALYVAFFPQLVAGPIERAEHLLPQMTRPRTLNLEQSYEGFWLIFWGLFKKVFIADNLSKIVNPVFAATGAVSGGEVWTAVYAFAFQIYGDFSGYSDMARGLAKLMGIELLVNFKHPYFVTNPREFWQNWHISLSTWLRDYLYIPLGGNRKGPVRTYINLMLTMLLGGLWHGAAWTFVVWGAYHGMLLVLHRGTGSGRTGTGPETGRHCEATYQALPKQSTISQIASSLPAEGTVKGILISPDANFGNGVRASSAYGLLAMTIMFHLTCLGWLIFRSNSLSQAGYFLHQMFFNFSFADPKFGRLLIEILQTVWLLLVVEIFQKLKKDDLVVFQWPVLARAAVYTMVWYFILLYGTGAQEFIYFQF